MKKSNKEDAVSPVIGVMLMLVITVVIAAVVTTFASGMTTDVEKSPSTVLDVTIDTDWTNGYGTVGTVILTSLNGDTLDLEKVVVNVYGPDGKTYTYANPSKSYTVGKYLESGEMVNLAYGVGSINGANPGLVSHMSFPLTFTMDTGGYDATFSTIGHYCQVTVVYDGNYVIFDKEVKVE